MDTKQLARIAKACRKAGITHYECADFKITLDLNEPVKVERSRPDGNLRQDLNPDKFQTDEPSQTDLLFWSTGEIQ